MANLTVPSEYDVPLGVECALPIGACLDRQDAPKSENATRKWRFGMPAGLSLTLAAAGFLLAAGGWQVGQGLYIQAKARLAQMLIVHAWQRTLAGERHVKPWPWADTWPVARLAAPENKIDLFVLSGADARTLAFGPGHAYGTALPGEKGNSVVGGHRDTHLGFLRDVKLGSELMVERQDGQRSWYRIKATQVLDKSETWVMKQDGDTRLTLVTCYPFDALQAGGDQRYVVTASAIQKS
jgi:sortase A